MQVFFWIAFLVVIGLAIFSVQNSDAPPVLMKFLFWEYRTSLVYMLLGAVGSGILLALLLCIPRMVRTSFQLRRLRREVEDLHSKPAETAIDF